MSKELEKKYGKRWRLMQLSKKEIMRNVDYKEYDVLPDYIPHRKHDIENKFITGKKKNPVRYVTDEQFFRSYSKQITPYWKLSETISRMLLMHLDINNEQLEHEDIVTDLNNIDYKDYTVPVNDYNLITDNRLKPYSHVINDKRYTVLYYK